MTFLLFYFKKYVKNLQKMVGDYQIWIYNRRERLKVKNQLCL